jgi:hypothetical protein
LFWRFQPPSPRRGIHPEPGGGRGGSYHLGRLRLKSPPRRNFRTESTILMLRQRCGCNCVAQRRAGCRLVADVNATPIPMNLMRKPSSLRLLRQFPVGDRWGTSAAHFVAPDRGSLREGRERCSECLRAGLPGCLLCAQVSVGTDIDGCVCMSGMGP